MKPKTIVDPMNNEILIFFESVEYDGSIKTSTRYNLDANETIELIHSLQRNIIKLASCEVYAV